MDEQFSNKVDKPELRWVLVERYMHDSSWLLVFRRGETVLEISVPEDAWRAFDGIKVEGE